MLIVLIDKDGIMTQKQTRSLSNNQTDKLYQHILHYINSLYHNQTMKYRNFDPTTDQPITAADLLKEFTEPTVSVKTFDISKLISEHKTPTTDEDLTSKYLKRFDKIADIINKNAIKKDRTVNSTKSSLNEFDKYLKNKYPLADLRVEEKLSILLKKRITEIMQDSTST